MGCAESQLVHPTGVTKRRTSTGTSTTIEINDLQHSSFGNIKKRYGHPMAFKADGYRILCSCQGRPPHITCYLAESAATGEKVSIQEYHHHAYPKEDQSWTLKELRLLARLPVHSMLPRLIEVFTTEGATYAVLEVIDPGRLTELLFPSDSDLPMPLGPSVVHHVIKTIVSALQFCHDHGVVLRDLRPSNFMVRSIACNSGADGVSMRDLALSKRFDLQVAALSLAVESGSGEDILRHPLAANAHEMEDYDDLRLYQPPVPHRSLPCRPDMDMWALGVLAYLLLSGHMPYTLEDLGNGDKDLFTEDIWRGGVSDRCRDFVQALLQSRVEDRLTSTQAIRHPFLLIGP